MENKLYFRAGEKSYDITESYSSSIFWYDWVERCKSSLRTMILSKRVLIWLCHLLRLASRVTGNRVNRWRMNDHPSTYFCSQKFNRAGRFISIIAVQRQRRSIIIIPELEFNGGWEILAQKIEAFINRSGPPKQEEIIQLSKHGSTFAEAITMPKWATKNGYLEMSNRESRCIKNSGFSGLSEKDFLNRCLVGRLSGDCYLVPTIAKVRRWVSSNWGSTVGVFNMNGFQFLFEFPTRSLAEQVKLGKWNLKQVNLELSWWSPTSGVSMRRLNLIGLGQDTRAPSQPLDSRGHERNW